MTQKKIIDKLQTPKAVKWFWIILVSPVALIVLLLLLIRLGVFGKLPTFEELENPKSNLATEIYSEDGQMIGSFFVQNRSYVDYSELSPALVAALTSTEDMRFYSHSGIDFISLARVAVKTMALGNRNQGGGSTITQQLAKNLYPRDTAVYDNPVSKGSKLVISKLKEWITAVMLEYNYTKEEILTMYLNTVLYGSNAYGIKSAARTFFNKLPSELNVQEAAMLVGVVNAPTQQSGSGSYQAQYGDRPDEGRGISDASPTRFDQGAADRTGLPSDFARRGYRHLFSEYVTDRDDLGSARPQKFCAGSGRRLGLQGGRRTVGQKSAVRLVSEKYEGERRSIRFVPRRAEDLYDDQCDDAEICREGRMGADGR